MRIIKDILNRIGLAHKIETGYDGMACVFSRNGVTFKVIASWGGHWEHASVPIIGVERTPTWDEMCVIKEILWQDEETVVQYHPAKENYINIHPFVLHLWKPIRERLAKPPTWMV